MQFKTVVTKKTGDGKKCLLPIPVQWHPPPHDEQDPPLHDEHEHPPPCPPVPLKAKEDSIFSVSLLPHAGHALLDFEFLMSFSNVFPHLLHLNSYIGILFLPSFSPFPCAVFFQIQPFGLLLLAFRQALLYRLKSQPLGQPLCEQHRKPVLKPLDGDSPRY